MSIKYCPKCARKHEYSIIAPTKCEKCGTVFASMFSTQTSQFANSEQANAHRTTKSNRVVAQETKRIEEQNDVDEDYYDENEVDDLKNQIMANLRHDAPIIIEGSSFESVRFGDLVAGAKAGRSSSF